MSALKISRKDQDAARDLEIRSDDIQEILGQVPNWIVRFGTMIILMVVALLFAAAIFLKYPDILVARVKLTTEIPPAELTANVAGRVEKVFVNDLDSVRSGDLLLVIESAASYHDVLLLAEQTDLFRNADSLVNINLPENLDLGSVQDTYANLQKEIQDYRDFLRLNYHSRKISSIKTELKKYNTYLSGLQVQERILGEEYRLAQRQYTRDSLLFTQEVLSSAKLEETESLKLNKLFSWNETKTELASAQIEITNLQQEILELELRLEESSRKSRQNLKEAFERLKGQIALWKNQYLIRSPFDGQITFTKIWSENQYVDKGEIVVTVIPRNQGDIIGITELSSKGAGKIREGHKVLIQFDNYPYMEFGTVSGQISSLSLVPNNEEYTAEIKLDSNVLVTNYNIRLVFQQNMPGVAEIITDDRNLMSRILAPFRSAINRQRTMGQN